MKWFRRICSASYITLHRGTVTHSSGKLQQWQLSSIAEILNAADVSQAEIWISTTGTSTFSPQIPSHLHQRLRNIIAG
jgi:hypothetical protein